MYRNALPGRKNKPVSECTKIKLWEEYYCWFFAAAFRFAYAMGWTFFLWEGYLHDRLHAHTISQFRVAFAIMAERGH